MKSFKYDSKVVEFIVSEVEAGTTKVDLQAKVFVELGGLDDPTKFGLVDKYIKHSGVKFSKPAGNWDACIEYFENADEPNKDDFTEAMRVHGMTDAQAKKYASSYWYPLNGMYKLYND